LQVVVQQIAAKIGWVVRVHADIQAAIQQMLQIVLVQAIKNLELDVGQRTDRQGNGVVGQILHQGRVVLAAHAVVDAFYFQKLKGIAYIAGRAFLTRVGDQSETQLSATGINLLE